MQILEELKNSERKFAIAKIILLIIMTKFSSLVLKFRNMDKFYIVAIVLFIGTRTDSARILAIFPTPSISHQVVFRPLTQELVKRGHEVVVITTDPVYPPGKAPVNFTEIDVRNVSYHSWQNVFVTTDIGKRSDIYKQVASFVAVFGIILEKQMQTKPVQDIVKNENNVTFDLLLIEMCVRPALAFSHVYKAPVISVSSNGLFFEISDRLGIPSNPLFYPVIPRQRLYNMTYWEKLKEGFSYYSGVYLYRSLEQKENEMLKKYFGPDVPPVSELYNNIHMFCQNVYHHFMDNTPVPPNVIHMGGLHQKQAKELPQDLNFYLNSSKNGVIYVSFGTNVKTSILDPERVQMMIRVFSKLPYDILWKMDNKELSGISNNIKISEWLPQADLLKHPKIKAFVMQGGLQSTDEAITPGVPLIGIPIYGDQWFNVEKYVRNGIGIKLDWDSFTEEEFMSAILEITEDASYRKNIERYRSIINDQLQRPLERAILWMEHVLRNGGAKHLRSPAANMSWAEYYELDLAILVIFGLIIVLLSLFLALYRIWLRVVAIFKRVKCKIS